MTTTQKKPRWQEILDEVTAETEAEKAAAALDLPRGETLVGVRQTEAARARLRENGIDPDSCDPDEFMQAFEAVGPQPDDVTVIRMTIPLQTEPVVNDDIDREARRLLVVRGLAETYETYAAARLEVAARKGAQ